MKASSSPPAIAAASGSIPSLPAICSKARHASPALTRWWAPARPVAQFWDNSGANLIFAPQAFALSRNDPPALLDGGHNPHALGKVLPEARKILGEKISLVFSALADKDWRQMVEILARNFPQARFFVPTLDNPRALAADVICGQINSRLPGQARMVKDSGAAFRLALDQGTPVLVIGSLYLLSEIYVKYPQYLLKTGAVSNGK